ncbi:MAG: hypothetical protein WDN31_12675 [Hyphomicrobium sp.]
MPTSIWHPSATGAPPRSSIPTGASSGGAFRVLIPIPCCRACSRAEEEKGFLDVVLHGQVASSAQYVRNTAIVTTILEDGNGNSVRITDFAPRFLLYERAFHPAQLVRRIEPLSGAAACHHPSAADRQLRAAGPSASPSAQTTCVLVAAPMCCA